MKLAPVPRLAAATWVATLLLLLPTGVFVGLVTELDAANVLDALLFGAVMQGMATLGVLIARREPRNPIGWIFCAAPALVAVAIASGVYATWADDHHPGAPGAAAADWVSSWTWLVGLAAYALLIPLLFPDGRPPGPRWRLVAGADLAAIAWIAALAGLSDTPPQPVVVATGVLVAVLIAAGLASAVLRYRRADVTQRVQIRECVFAACAAFVGFFAISVIAPHEALYALDYALLPLSVGLAMLRYRLYDVDVIIRKTLVYGCLVAVLVGVYLAGRHAAGRGASGSHRIVGDGRGHPLDARRGGCVPAAAAPDRAGRRSAVLPIGVRRAGCRGCLQRAGPQQIDLDALCGELLQVVSGPVSPPHASIWLRPVTNRERPSGTTDLS